MCGNPGVCIEQPVLHAHSASPLRMHNVTDSQKVGPPKAVGRFESRTLERVDVPRVHVCTREGDAGKHVAAHA